jgi:aspartyl-tRNA(Asn)/glutamyl-tRNA(Gln) amidotransferase subunit B
MSQALSKVVETFEPVIGLEVHVQLATRTKAFCGCPSSFGEEPNSSTCSVCLGLPGALPVLNATAVAFALRLGLATSCEIRRRSRFARKNYFYPDLPKGYQISQYDEPLCQGGRVEVDEAGEGSGPHAVRLTRIHMEEDAGKNLHTGGGHSLVDFNRSGVPLCEVVSEPDLRSADEAVAYLKALRTLVRWIGVSDGNMEEGSLRCDANVSVRPRGQERLGTRVELKNINSFKHVKSAIEYEIVRQAELVQQGGQVVQETRLWDVDRGVSRSMRSKEEAHDYRYFPEPDLPPLVIDEAWIGEVQAAMPELPPARRARFESQYGLPGYDARLLTSERELGEYFEAMLDERAVGARVDAKRAANWVTSELLARVADARDVMNAERCPVRPVELGRLCALIDEGTISGKIAKDVFARMWQSGRGAREIVESEGLVQVSDSGAIEQAVREVVARNLKQKEQYRAGKTAVLGFFVGQVMRATGGKANPERVNELLRKVLAED